MKFSKLLVVCLGLAAFPVALRAQESISDVLADPALDFNRPADRARAVERIRIIENAGLARARAKANAMGIPMREVLPDGTVTEIMGLDENGEFLIYTTHNANAAISSAANLVHPAPYNLDGTGVTVGVWDENAVRATHVEFQAGSGSRVTVKDGANPPVLSSHATHVAGTIAAVGVSTAAKGMAPNAKVDSYNWTSDTSEMLGRGATAPGQVDKIYISNHSYGYTEGWNSSNVWTGTGTDQNAYDPQFGQYAAVSRTWDDIAFKLPYYLIFKSAGNDNSNNPTTGATVTIGGVTTTYNPSVHPKGDGLYRNTTTNSANGYENIGTTATSKNMMSVGAADDAVSDGLRDPAKSTLTDFSSRGPTDDGRIKPDIVANGLRLTSTDINSDIHYSEKSGTSMSGPSAAGSAALLVQQYANLFSGGAMRASTLKGLILHTATDIGNPGPDYHYGWGLINTKEAADLIIDHHANPSKSRMIEDQITTASATKIYSIAWDGSSPLRATICWTDPPGASTNAHDSRTPTLVNNLNLKLIAPNGNEYFPFVMPFVGTWTVASMSLPATTGINNTDNVEQVLIQNPGQTGTWQAVVSYSGALANNLQNFSLLFSGVSDGIIPLVLQSITPNSGTVGSTITTDIVGTNLSTDTTIRLRQPGRADLVGTAVQMINATTLRCQFNLAGAASGAWNLVATNPDAETYTLPDAFTISGSLTTIWNENFDGVSPPAGWATTAQQGSNSWSIVTTASHSPTKSYFAAGPASVSITHLTSPAITMPTSATNLSLEFWHRYDLQADRDCGKFYLSIDNGAWFEVTSANSGVAFILNGYNYAALSSSPSPQQASKYSPFAGQPAWSGTTGGTFVRTAINFTDIPKYAGKSLRLRWTIATNDSTASTGWWVDSIALRSDSSEPNQAPVITLAASTDTEEFETVGPTTYHILRGTGTNLSVTANDDAGESDLTYTWQSSGPAAVIYSLNESNAAKSTTATFSTLGDYAITVTALDTGGLSTTSTVNVRVLETSTFDVAPDSVILGFGDTQQFTATLINQFGTPNAIQPAPITWSSSGGGTISSGGLFTATIAGGPYTITASASPYTATAEVAVNRSQAGIELQNLSRIYNGSPQVVTAITSPPGLTYNVTYQGQSTAPTNGGSYEVVATITDPNYEGGTSGTLVIAKATQSITFAALDPVGNDQLPFALTGTASSGLAVSYASSNPSVATVSGNTVTINGAGTSSITASQAGDSNYLPATSVARELEVVPVIPTAVPSGPYKVLVGQSLMLDGSASTPSFGETLTAHAWDLNHDGNFGDATGVTPPAIPFDDLINVWGMKQGLNTIHLQVTDSAAKTDTASTTVELVLALQWDANGTTPGQTNGGGVWLGDNLWWDGADNVNWASVSNAIFGGPSTAGGIVTLASPTTVNSFVFNAFTGTYTLGTSGQVITLNDGINKSASSAAVTFASPITLSGNQTWTNNSSEAVTTGSGTNLINNGGYQLTVDGPGTHSFGVTSSSTEVVTGSGNLIKNGSGRLNVGGVNSGFSGTVTINQGILHTHDSADALGAGNLTLNGGVLSFYWGTTYTRTLAATGDGTVQILGGESGFAGSGTTGPTINLGSTVVWGNAGQGTATGFFNPSKFILGDSGTANAGATTFSSAIDLNGSTRTILVPAGNSAGRNRSTVSGRIFNSTGTAGLIKEGAGWLFLTQGYASTNVGWNGTTTINEGMLDFTNANMANIGGGSARNITVAEAAGVRFSILSNALLNRIVNTTAEITVMTGTTANSLDFSSNTGANLPNAFLGNWAGNGAKCEISGTITPAADHYRLGSPLYNSGLLGITSTSPMSGNQGLVVGGGSVELVGPKQFSGDTTIRNGARLGLAAISGADGVAYGLQNSALDTGTPASTGTIWLESAPADFITGAVSTTSAVFGGLIGSRNLLSVYSTSTGANNSAATAVASITGFTLNPGSGKSHIYSGAIANFAADTTLAKTGLGTQILAGASTYSGATTITAGRLFINGSLSNVNAALTVQSGATLGGTGTIGRNVTIENDGKLEFDLSTPAASHDRLDLSSGRDFAFSGASELTITTSGGATPGTYTLVTGGNAITGSAPATLKLPSDWVATAEISGNSLLLHVISVDGGTPGSLAVAGADGLTSSGFVGVSFSPDSIQYTLSNPGEFPINWTAGKTAAWLDLSATSGTLDAGANATVTVSINDNAKDLVVGTYNDTVTFTNTSNGTGNTTRAVSLTVTTPPTLISIIDDMSGGSVSINTLVTYTVTFSEDMDASTVTAEDFGNAGTSAVTIGAVTEMSSSPGVFVVLATPTTSGTLQLRINQDAVLKNAAGNNLVTTSAILDDTVINVLTPYQSWANGTFANPFTAREPGDDDDNDGAMNLMEYAFGTDPTDSSITPITYSEGVVTAHGQPVLVEEGGNYYAVFGRRVNHAAAGLNYAVRFSADLETGYWSTSAEEATVLATDGVIDAVRVPFPGPVASTGGPKNPRFFQVVITGN